MISPGLVFAAFDLFMVIWLAVAMWPRPRTARDPIETDLPEGDEL